jgi:hypothetical protein
MDTLVKIKSGWLGDSMSEDEKKDGEVYDELLKDTSKEMSSSSRRRRGSVADVVAKFEESTKSLSMDASDVLDSPIATKSSCSQKAYSGASLLLGFVTGLTSRGAEEEEDKSPIRPKAPAKHCRICEKKLFPTDETTTCRSYTYHIGCFRCALCSSKLKNHPDEVHKLVVTGEGQEHMLLQCRQCGIDNEHKNKPRRKSRKAGERIVVEDSEQGDVENVVDAIGDDLEEAMYGMIPRCALCGGDFLSYEGEISIVGSLKYHNDCFLWGKPGTGSGSVTLPPVQAARYLPDNLILKVATPEGKSLTTLFFVWKDKEAAVKRLRNDRPDHVTATFELDEEARNNPNYKEKSEDQKKATVPLPPMNGEEANFTLELVGGAKIAPEPPQVIAPPRVIKAYQKPTILRGTIRYVKYGLDHTLELTIPCNWKGDTLRLHCATLAVNITGPSENEK